MDLKIWSALLFVCFSFVSLSAQTRYEDQVQSLQEEIENLKSIQQELRREYDSLIGLKNNKLPSGYYIRMNGRFVENDAVTYSIMREQVGGKQVYSIGSFFNPTAAYRMAYALRMMNMRDVEVVKIDETSSLSSQPSRKKISRTMEIID